MKFDNKKKVVFFLIIGLVGVLVLLLFVMKERKVKPSPGGDPSDIGIEMTLPDAVVTEVESSKVSAFSEDSRRRPRQGGDINDIWDSLMEENLENYSDSGNLKKGKADDDRRSLSDDELLEKYFGIDPEEDRSREKLAAEASSLRRGSGGGGGGGSVRPAATSPAPAPAVAPAPAPKQEAVSEPEPAVEEPAAEPSRGVVHSMKAEMRRGGTSSGVSSRRPAPSAMAQASSPVRCQFVRDETLSTGDRVTVRLLDALDIGGVKIPANTRLVANVTLGSRLELSFVSYQADGKFFSMNYSAYDTDGQRGIFCTTADSNASAAGDQAIDQAAGIASSVLSGIGGVAGRAASGALSIGRTAIRQGKEKASVSSGYTFYILENSKN